MMAEVFIIVASIIVFALLCTAATMMRDIDARWTDDGLFRKRDEK